MFRDTRKVLIEEIKEEEKIEKETEYLLNNFTHLTDFLNKEFTAFNELIRIEQEKKALARELQQIEMRLRTFLSQIHEFDEYLKRGNWSVSLKELGIPHSFRNFLKRFVDVALERIERLCEEEKRILDKVKQEINQELKELKTIIKAERGELKDLSELEHLIEREKIYLRMQSPIFPIGKNIYYRGWI